MGAIAIISMFVIILRDKKLELNFGTLLLGAYCLTARPPIIAVFLILFLVNWISLKQLLKLAGFTALANLFGFMLISNFAQTEYQLFWSMQEHFEKYETSGALQRFNNSLQAFIVLMSKFFEIDAPLFFCRLLGMCTLASYGYCYFKNRTSKQNADVHIIFIVVWLAVFLPVVPDYHWAALLPLLLLPTCRTFGFVGVSLAILVAPKHYFILGESVQMLLNPVLGFLFLISILYCYLRRDNASKLWEAGQHQAN